MKKNEIKDALAKVNEWRHIDSKEVGEILDGLVPQELKLHHGVYRFLNQSANISENP